MKWNWSNFWRRLWPWQDDTPGRESPWGWGASTAQVVAVIVAFLLFGGLAVWIIVRSVAFVSAYGAMTDKFVK